MVGAIAAGIVLLAIEARADEYQPLAKPGIANDAGSRRRIVVSLANRKLALIRDGITVKVYPVAVGSSSSPSPAGQFRIRQRVSNPAYYHPGIVIPPGKENPLGTRWLGLNLPGYGIHGTNQPESIGRNSSHGCIRMRNRDVEELFQQVRAGDPVEILSGLDKETSQLFGTANTTQAAATTPDSGTVAGN